MATLVQAVRMALHYGEERLGVTDVFGEDVGPPLGGVFTATQGLRTACNSPLDERGLLGMAMGIAYAGGRPVCEIQFCDYGFNIIDLLKVAGNQRWSGAGQYDMPIVVMTPSGSGIRGSLYHSHSFESWATRLAGWKIVMPSTALDAYGLMLSAIADPNPVMVLLPKALLRVRGEQLIPGEPADEDTEVTNFGEHLVRVVVEEHFYDLAVRPRVLCGKHLPGIGLNQVYEWNEVPQLPDVLVAMRDVATEPA